MHNYTKQRPVKVWMNVTASANWSRPAVGIIRVEREVSKELKILYGENLDFCIFNGSRFVPYGRKTVVTAVPQPQPRQHTLSAFRRSSSFDPVLDHVKRAEPAETKAPNILYDDKDKGAVDIDDIMYGDVVLSIGLDWGQEYINEFYRLKNDKGVKIVTCCYDLIPVLMPQYCSGDVAPHFIDYFTKISWASSRVLCISQRSEADYIDLIRKIGAPEVETVVIPLGDNVPKSGGNADRQAVSLDISAEVRELAREPFILFVSTIERRKNHEVLYRAYHLLAKEGRANDLPKLVFVGMAGWGVSDLLKDIELDPLTKDLIVQLNHVSDDELAYLYENSYICAYPSLYEGWGLPIGEALASGKAVIASALGSIPEVGGDLVRYLDPWKPRAWADEILNLVENPARVWEMEAAVRADYKPRTWRDTAAVVKRALEPLRESSNVSVTLYPGHDLRSLVGTPCGEAIRSTGTEGILTFGPYRTLPPATYQIEIAIDKIGGTAGKLRCILRSSQGHKDHAFLDIAFDEREHFGVIASLSDVAIEQQIDDYEMCCIVSDGLKLAINKITIRQS